MTQSKGNIKRTAKPIKGIVDYIQSLEGKGKQRQENKLGSASVGSAELISALNSLKPKTSDEICYKNLAYTQKEFPLISKESKEFSDKLWLPADKVITKEKHNTIIQDDMLTIKRLLNEIIDKSKELEDYKKKVEEVIDKEVKLAEIEKSNEDVYKKGRKATQIHQSYMQGFQDGLNYLKQKLGLLK